MVKAIKFLMITSLLLSLPVFSSPASFKLAKKIARVLFSEHRETLYCGCQYNEHYDIDLASCQMQAADRIKRAHRVEWEHMMRAENFGRQRPCWHEKLCQKKGSDYKGRTCCDKIDPAFRQAKAELYNLWPAVGLVNQARSNYRFSSLERKQGFYGCNIEIDSKLRKVDPLDRAKGLVARANLFMLDKYSIQLSVSQRNLFKAWNVQYPPTRWEREWAQAIAEIEGYSNPYIQ